MLRLASALSHFITRDPNSPSTSRPVSPAPRKTSLKSKPTWRSASVHADNRTQGFKCPFTATNALTAVTKKEIDAYNSSEEIRTSDQGKEPEVNGRELCRRSLCVTLEEKKGIGEPIQETAVETEEEESSTKAVAPIAANDSESLITPESAPTSPDSEGKKAIPKPAVRKTSCTLALDVYKRRGSIIPTRTRQNSLSVIYGEKLNTMKEIFGTPEKVMNFFGRCFVKFFSNYG